MTSKDFFYVTTMHATGETASWILRAASYLDVTKMNERRNPVERRKERVVLKAFVLN